MKALGIIETFDVIEDGGAGLLVGGKCPAIDQFPFEGTPEAFHGGVVVAITRAAHGGDQACPCEGVAIIGGGILDPAIGVAEELGGRLAVQEGHGQSL